MTYRNFIHLFIGLICIFSSSIVFAQKPFDMARDVPTQVWPGKHGLDTHIAELDTSGVDNGSEFLIIDLPDGSVVELKRDRFKKRGKAKHTVWIGKAVDYPDSRAVLTIKNGIMFGRLRINENVYEIRFRANEYSASIAGDEQKNYVVEQLNLDSFPENDEDGLTAPESDIFISDDQTDPDAELAFTASTAGDATVIIDLMSLYTPTTRSAAGGVANIEATIQAAVDATNAAFTDSGMNVQYRLVHVAESSYDESSTSIGSDLDWLIADAGVAALRDQYGADMVSLIIENGGSSCGIGYVQRTPSPFFAPYAFQVTDRGCAVGNLTFAHEHGHNQGFEHNPENSSASSSSASYAWSFGHYTNNFRTVMSYGSICSWCTRVGRFSTPNVSYFGELAGIVDQRDNARTGNLTAPIIAAYRPTVVPIGNNAPVFNQDPITGSSVEAGLAIVGSLAGSASDADGDSLSYSKASGPSWLNVAANGDLSGVPAAGDVGLNSFTVQVSDGNGGVDTATLNIDVTDAPIPPSPGTDLTVTVSADNIDEVYVNGVLLGSSSVWKQASSYQVALQEGENVIAVKGMDAGGIAGLIAELSWSNNAAVSDSTWKVSTTEQTGWNNTGFNDSGWGNATSYGTYGISPWSTNVNGISNGSSAEWIWTADANGDNTVYFRYVITIGDGTPPPPPSNTVPTFNQDPITGPSVEADQAVVGSLAGTASDADTDPLSYSKVSGPSWLSVAANGDLSGVPAAGDVGLNSFTVQVSDGNGGVDSATLNIDVTDAPIPPSPGTDLTVTVSADNIDEVYVNGVLLGSSSVWKQASSYQVALQEGENVIAVKGMDAGGIAGLIAELSWSNNAAVSDNTWKVATTEQTGWNNTGFNDSAWDNATSYGTYGISPWSTNVSGISNGSSAEWIWTADANGDNTVYFRYVITIDSGTQSGNSAPAFNQDPITGPSVEADQAIVGSLTGTAGDADTDPLSYSKVSGPNWLSVAANGDLSGVPAAGDVGLNSFIVQVSDGNGGVDTATLNIDVTAVTPPPPAGSELTLTISSDNINEVYVNGVLIGSSSVWKQAISYQVALQSGVNVIAVKGMDAGGIAGLIAEMGWPNNAAVSDSSWKVSTTEQPGWNTSSFDDSSWVNATSYGVYGVSPWSTNVSGIANGSSAEWIWTNDANGDNTVYFRYEINI